MTEVTYVTDFLGQPVRVNVLKGKLVPFRTCGLDIYKVNEKWKGKKRLGLPIMVSLSLIMSKLVKLGFECYKLLGFRTKSVSKSMSWRLRGNDQFSLKNVDIEGADWWIFQKIWSLIDIFKGQVCMTHLGESLGDVDFFPYNLIK